ncbi:MAG: hypothetical protein L0Z54_07005 [Thermoplasmata archaeon]|nr:hypothetical protein [Thermoplasmata archaeon]
MSYSVLLHPDVARYLDSLPARERKRCYSGLKGLEEDPYLPRSGCDVKKMRGARPYSGLRVGKSRFLYVVSGREVLVEEAFERGRGY